MTVSRGSLRSTKPICPRTYLLGSTNYYGQVSCLPVLATQNRTARLLKNAFPQNRVSVAIFYNPLLNYHTKKIILLFKYLSIILTKF